MRSPSTSSWPIALLLHKERCALTPSKQVQQVAFIIYSYASSIYLLVLNRYLIQTKPTGPLIKRAPAIMKAMEFIKSSQSMPFLEIPSITHHSRRPAATTFGQQQQTHMYHARSLNFRFLHFPCPLVVHPHYGNRGSQST